MVLKPGDTLNVSCDLVSGIPTPVITWSLGGEMITSSRAAVIDGQLTVTSLQLGDGGVYMCAATNVVGEDYFVFRLVVEGESSSSVSLIVVSK